MTFMTDTPHIRQKRTPRCCNNSHACFPLLVYFLFMIIPFLAFWRYLERSFGTFSGNHHAYKQVHVYSYQYTLRIIITSSSYELNPSHKLDFCFMGF